VTYVDHRDKHEPWGSDAPRGFIGYLRQNLGRWLYVVADSIRPSGYAIEFVDESVDGGVLISSDGGSIDLAATQVAVNGSSGWVFQTARTLRIGPGDAGDTTIWWYTGTSGAAGESLLIRDESGNGLLRIDSDGSLHGRTGKALTFDL
jgi:hypothetical protein